VPQNENEIDNSLRRQSFDGYVHLNYQIEQLTLIASRHSAVLSHLIQAHVHQGSDLKPRLAAAAAEHQDALDKLKTILDLQHRTQIQDGSEQI